MAVTAKKIKYMDWDCVEVSDGKVSAIVTTEVGPRIIFYGFKGGFNHMAVLDAFREHKKGNGKGFTHYGGHRIWHAPEHPERTYQPDDAKVSVDIEDGVAIFSQKQEATGIVKMMKLEFIDDNKLAVAQKFVNNSMFPIKCSIWGITQFATGGMLAVPQSKNDTGLIANRAVSLWPYSKMTDKRVYWGDKFITVEQADIVEPFKLGTTCDMEYAAYFNNNELVIKHFPYVPGGEYPNFHCNFESYTNNEFMEIESLSPLDTIEAYGGELEIEEIWEVYANIARPARDDEETLDEISSKYNKDFEDCMCCDDGCGDDCGCGCDCKH